MTILVQYSRREQAGNSQGSEPEKNRHNRLLLCRNLQPPQQRQRYRAQQDINDDIDSPRRVVKVLHLVASYRLQREIPRSADRRTLEYRGEYGADPHCADEEGDDFHGQAEGLVGEIA